MKCDPLFDLERQLHLLPAVYTATFMSRIQATQSAATRCVLPYVRSEMWKLISIPFI